MESESSRVTDKELRDTSTQVNRNVSTADVPFSPSLVGENNLIFLPNNVIS